MNRDWWEYRDTFLAVMDYGIETGEFVTAVELSRYVEKPWSYKELHQAWTEDQERQAEQQWLDRYADV